MDPKNLFELRYRHGSTGVTVGFITAEDQAQAEAISHAFCNQRVNCRFIRVRPAVIADASILTSAKKDPAVDTSEDYDVKGVVGTKPVEIGSGEPTKEEVPVKKGKKTKGEATDSAPA